MKQALAVVAVLSLLGPCAKKDEGAADAAQDAVASAAEPAEAAAPAAAEPQAKNAASVGRFPNETKLGMEKAKLLANLTMARESPGGGAVVASLAKDTEVTKVAERGDDYLIAFSDPKDAASTLMGWITKSGFTPTPAALKLVDGGTAVVDAGVPTPTVTDAGTPVAAKDAGTPSLKRKALVR